MHANMIEIAWPFIGPVQNGGGVAPYYGPGSPFTSPGSWSSHVTSDVWAKIAAAGYDGVRIPFPPGVLIDCIGNPVQTAVILTVLQGAIADCIAHGVGVLLCLEDSFDVAAYAPAALLGSGVTSAIWLARLAVTTTVCAFVAANWTPQQVAIELFNEPGAPSSILVNTWDQYQRTLFAAARAGAPLHTLLLTATNFSAIADLVAMDPSPYGPNTGFVFHNYLPFIFAQQGYQNGFNTWVNGLLNWPPDPSQSAAALSGMTANVNADSTLTSGQKTSTIASQTAQIGFYLNTPEGDLYINQQFDLLVNWCNTWGLVPDRIFITEFGTTRTNAGGFGGTAFTGVAQPSRVLWKAGMRAKMASRGFRFCEFALDDPRYGITDGTGVTIGSINT